MIIARVVAPVGIASASDDRDGVLLRDRDQVSELLQRVDVEPHEDLVRSLGDE
jgi:hypothetical protein